MLESDEVPFAVSAEYFTRRAPFAPQLDGFPGGKYRFAVPAFPGLWRARVGETWAADLRIDPRKPGMVTIHSPRD